MSMSIIYISIDFDQFILQLQLYMCVGLVPQPRDYINDYNFANIDIV